MDRNIPGRDEDKMKNIIFKHLNCGMKKLEKRRTSQLNKQLMQLRKENLKKYRLARFSTLTNCARRED